MKMLCCGIITPKRETAEKWALRKLASERAGGLCVQRRLFGFTLIGQRRVVIGTLCPDLDRDFWSVTLTETQP